MSERRLARLVQRFELLASDVITEHGGRVIKTVGDEVLFVHTDAAAASAIALDLVDAMAEDELLPPVRVGLAHGRVVSRLGDVFGMTVNKASRITAVTPSGHVYVDEDMAARSWARCRASRPSNDGAGCCAASASWPSTSCTRAGWARPHRAGRRRVTTIAP